MRSYEKLRTRRGRRRARGFRPTAIALETRRLLAVITVTSTGDAIANDGFTTLREAITAANTNADPSGDTTPGDPGFDFINFDIPDTDPNRDPVTGVFTITIGSALPDIVETVTIDGYTQGTISTPGDTSDDATPNTLDVGNDARLLIALDGGGGAFDGLVFTAGGNAVRGLVIGNFGGNGIVLRTGGGNTVAGNFIGTNAAGDAEANNGGGIFLDNSPSNQIGGSDPADRNVILGNTNPAIHTPVPSGTDPGDAAGGNTIQGNYVGTNAQGTAVLGQTGIYLSDGENQVGGTTVTQRNVISTQGQPGIFLDETGASDNTIEGNYIGLTADGTAALGNGEGIRIERGNGNFIGGAIPEARNVIVSGSNGIVLFGGGGGPAVERNKIIGNYIGTNAAGDAVLPAGGSGGSGVFVISGVDNEIGGSDPGSGNVIAGFAFGVRFLNDVLDNTGNLVQGNFIGTDATGTAALPGSVGIALVAAGGAETTGNTIADNVISGNTSHGIIINGANGNLFQGNRIGVAADGTTALGNGGDGIQIVSGSDNTIGGFTSGDGNTIANNGTTTSVSGIRVLAGTGNRILGNAIFDNGGLGIDLNGLGVTDNDDGDGDTGPNNLQNFPVLTTATIIGNDATIVGTFNSTAGRSFRVEFFASAAGDPSGNGEGEIFLGFADVMTDGSGNATINQPLSGLPASVVAGMFITATATDLTTNDTSEFAAFVELQAGGVEELDLSLDKSAPAGAVTVGQELTYTIVVQSAPGLATTTGVRVIDTLPANVEFVSATGGVTPVGNQLTFELGTLASGDSITLEVVVRPLAAAAGTTITNTATVESDVTETNTDNNTDSADVSVLATPAADVSVQKTAPQGPVAVGQDLTYTIVVANAAGALDATSVVVTDTLPADVEFVSATGGVTPSNGVLTFNLGTLAGGASTTLEVTVRPLAAAAGTTITNTALAASDIDADDSNNESSADVSVRAAQFDVGVQKTASTDSPRIGQDITYTIVVTNDGPDTATGVVLTDTLPANATFISATGGITPVGGVLTFNVDPLANGASATFTVVVRPTGDAGVELANTATVQGGAADNNPDNDTDTSTLTLLAALTDVSVTKTPSATSVQVGQNLTYTIVVTNTGPSQATGVTVTDVLPSGLTFVSSSAGSFDATTRTFTADLGTLGAGETRTITLVVQPTASAAGTSISNSASVTRAEADSDAANDTAAAAAVSVSRVPTDTTPPVVLRVRRYGFHAQQTLLVLRFSERLDPRTALNRKSYFVRGQGPDHRLGTADDSTITVAAVAYDASTRTVTLRLRRRLYEFTNFRLFVRGTGRNAITDLAGNVLDGDRDGNAGGDASFLLNRKVIVGRANQAPLADQVGIPVPKASAATRLAAARSATSVKQAATRAAASSKSGATTQANLSAVADRLGAVRVALHDDATSLLTSTAKNKRR
jgi:uncharacterized repeat protein (TIGR01451 family)